MKEKRYGQWAGNPIGRAEDKTRCFEEIRGWPGHLFVQCSRKRGFGPNGLYCKQHAKRHINDTEDDSK